ncbi:olfactory receptor 5W2-like protein, partial [Cricetulus griseus]
VEYMLLAMMAFDRYKAISNPLLYAVDMSSKVCYQLLAVVYLVAKKSSIVKIFYIFFIHSSTEDI